MNHRNDNCKGITMSEALEGFMSRGLKILAISAALAAAQSGTALAQYAACPPGYAFYAGVCQPTGYSNPVSGAVSGTQAGAAAGSAAAGPVGGIVGGALGVAGGTVAGTTNAVTGTVGAVTGVPAPAPACPPGYMLYNGACYPAR
jgi:hypothetical protein